ncbi:MAG: basic amino acid/polyamine antiporter [Limosilactobacillus sp.]|uniref:basic amino acid/polyamine antiporter n=1 Tax=Limosilactobacillus sp. TaxID=2773925 RepID=UPI002710ED32|nr:basic amino acid/polyamine antiporter [Limosilactobacillus sp.]
MEKKASKSELVALIVSSCIGAGVFGITQNLASVSAPGPALLAWLFSGFGFLMLVLSINNLSRKRPELDAGIFSYAGAGFGPLGEFISGWFYWLSAWLGSIAFATMMMDALGFFIPIFKNTTISIITAIFFCWLLTFIVDRGIEGAMMINQIATIFKVLPLLIFIMIMVVSFKAHVFTADFWGHVASNTYKSGSVFTQMKSCLFTLIWVTIGVESANVMANRAKSRTEAEKATIIALIFLMIFYVLISILPYGVLSRAELAGTPQPALGYVLEKVVGHWGSILIDAGLVISSAIAWLSWTMLPAETARLLADDKVMPKYWTKENKIGSPTTALVITGILETFFLFTLFFTKNAYEFAYSLCSSAILFSYLFVGLYQMKYSWKERDIKQFVIGLFAAAFQIACMFLAGLSTVLLVWISVIPGFVVFLHSNIENHRSLNTREKWVMGILLLVGIGALAMLIAGKITV